jgi:hypothetical protein
MTDEFKKLANSLSQKETDETWSALEQSLQKVSILASTTTPSVLLIEIKNIHKGIVNCLNSERSRLFKAALECVESIAVRCGPLWESSHGTTSLAGLFVPALLKQTSRANKTFSDSSTKSLVRIVQNTDGLAVLKSVKTIVCGDEIIKSKTRTLRICASEMIHAFISSSPETVFSDSSSPLSSFGAGFSSRELMDVLEGVIAKQIEDSDASVRDGARASWGAYESRNPVRADAFFSCLGATARKYLSRRDDEDTGGSFTVRQRSVSRGRREKEPVSVEVKEEEIKPRALGGGARRNPVKQEEKKVTVLGVKNRVNRLDDKPHPVVQREELTLSGLALELGKLAASPALNGDWKDRVAVYEGLESCLASMTSLVDQGQSLPSLSRSLLKVSDLCTGLLDGNVKCVTLCASLFARSCVLAHSLADVSLLMQILETNLGRMIVAVKNPQWKMAGLGGWFERIVQVMLAIDVESAQRVLASVVLEKNVKVKIGVLEILESMDAWGHDVVSKIIAPCTGEADAVLTQLIKSILLDMFKRDERKVMDAFCICKAGDRRRIEAIVGDRRDWKSAEIKAWARRGQGQERGKSPFKKRKSSPAKSPVPDVSPGFVTTPTKERFLNVEAVIGQEAVRGLSPTWRSATPQKHSQPASPSPAPRKPSTPSKSPVHSSVPFKSSTPKRGEAKQRLKQHMFDSDDDLDIPDRTKRAVDRMDEVIQLTQDFVFNATPNVELVKSPVERNRLKQDSEVQDLKLQIKSLEEVKHELTEEVSKLRLAESQERTRIHFQLKVLQEKYERDVERQKTRNVEQETLIEQLQHEVQAQEKLVDSLTVQMESLASQNKLATQSDVETMMELETLKQDLQDEGAKSRQLELQLEEAKEMTERIKIAFQEEKAEHDGAMESFQSQWETRLQREKDVVTSLQLKQDEMQLELDQFLQVKENTRLREREFEELQRDWETLREEKEQVEAELDRAETRHILILKAKETHEKNLSLDLETALREVSELRLKLDQISLNPSWEEEKAELEVKLLEFQAREHDWQGDRQTIESRVSELERVVDGFKSEKETLMDRLAVRVQELKTAQDDLHEMEWRLRSVEEQGLDAQKHVPELDPVDEGNLMEALVDGGIDSAEFLVMLRRLQPSSPSLAGVVRNRMDKIIAATEQDLVRFVNVFG